jgi:hypothetical protein
MHDGFHLPLVDDVLMHVLKDGAVKIVAAAEVIVHRGYVHPSFLAYHLAGGIGIAMLGEKPDSRFEDVAACDFAVFADVLLAGEKGYHIRSFAGTTAPI